MSRAHRAVPALRLTRAAALCLLLAACATVSRRGPPVPRPSPPPAPAPPPGGVESVPDAVPRAEPRSAHGNPPFYGVLGRRYFVLATADGYLERGVASWYGPTFHGGNTSSGEPYDMYAMTAAHKTLPLPAYVRVTNLLNGRSVVVRVNDRGPFVGNRIIDLSYTAAAKLDMLRNGTAMVEVRTIDPSAPPPVITASVAPPAPGAPTGVPAAVAPAAAAPTTAVPNASGAAAVNPPLFVQAGAFSDPANAERLAEKLRGGGFGKIFVRDDRIAGRRMYRVRIGPVSNVAAFDRVVAALERAGISDAHLALD